ncbi:MAG: alpha/beta hydrolase [Nitrosomonadales bacterium]|nr:alpha/beta hydrolase [Nitrosomonadales bacterium]
MERYIDTKDGLTLWTESFGDQNDPPLLLIMGAMNQGIFWPDGFCERLAAAGFHVIRYDHRDTGKSSRVDFQHAPYDLDTLAEDAINVIRGYKVEQPIVIGLSMGGYIAQLIGIRHPGIAAKLVLISTSADHRPYMAATTGQDTSAFSLPAPEKSFLDYLESMRSHPPQTAAEMMAAASNGWAATYGGPRPYPRIEVERALRLAADRTSDPSASFHHAFAVAASPDRLQSVKTIALPTLVIHGRYDPCFPPAHGEYLARHIPDARLQVFEMGHSFMWSWDDEVLDAVLDFIRDN